MKTSISIKVAFSTPNLILIEALLENGHKIGYAHLFLNQKTAELIDIFVRCDYVYLWPEVFPIFRRKYNFRGQGVGRQLISKAKQQTRALGYKKIIGEIHGDISKLNHFYTQCGFTISGHNLSLDL